MIHFEPVEYQAKPSPEYIDKLRQIGASEGTIRRALGEVKPRRRWFKRFSEEEDIFP